MDAERAHHLALTCLKAGLAPKTTLKFDPMLSTKVCGMSFQHPIGLAAGFEKQGDAIANVLDLGFGFVEIGTVVPLPQAGNPKPRMFRIPQESAVINRLGFNSDGMEKILERVEAFFETHKNKLHAPVGINIGKNKDSPEGAEDYVRGMKAFAPYADYITINISSPNTPGLRDLQRRAPLEDLLQQALEARSQCHRQPPVFVKIAPDQTEAQMQDIADVTLASGIDGIIISNTTMSRPLKIPADMAGQAGGLSGKPLLAMSTKILGDMYKLTQGKIPLIGVGGVSSGADAYSKIRAGASLVQIYTSLIYEGPFVISRIANELSALLKRDGFSSLEDAVGIDFR
jgi:dihydroorotate dehydrogenase